MTRSTSTTGDIKARDRLRGRLDRSDDPTGTSPAAAAAAAAATAGYDDGAGAAAGTERAPPETTRSTDFRRTQRL
jgi:hypothetical protein